MTDDLNEKLIAVFADMWESENHPRYTDMLEKFIFHMSDAADDIRRLAGLLEYPNAVDRVAFEQSLHQFFLHALPHLLAAGQLYNYVPEIFPEQRGVHPLPGEE